MCAALKRTAHAWTALKLSDVVSFPAQDHAARRASVWALADSSAERASPSPVACATVAGGTGLFPDHRAKSWALACRLLGRGPSAGSALPHTAASPGND